MTAWLIAHQSQWGWFWAGFAVCAFLNFGFAVMRLDRK